MVRLGRRGRLYQTPIRGDPATGSLPNADWYSLQARARGCRRSASLGRMLHRGISHESRKTRRSDRRRLRAPARDLSGAPVSAGTDDDRATQAATAMELAQAKAYLAIHSDAAAAVERRLAEMRPSGTESPLVGPVFTAIRDQLLLDEYRSNHRRLHENDIPTPEASPPLRRAASMPRVTQVVLLHRVRLIEDTLEPTYPQWSRHSRGFDTSRSGSVTVFGCGGRTFGMTNPQHPVAEFLRARASYHRRLADQCDRLRQMLFDDKKTQPTAADELKLAE
jgi:hypothetical protein